MKFAQIQSGNGCKFCDRKSEKNVKLIEFVSKDFSGDFSKIFSKKKLLKGFCKDFTVDFWNLDLFEKP